jgi:uncharacterized protein YuzE
MHIEYDVEADALYITLKEAPYAYGRDLDDSRRIDYAADGIPVGVEILFPSQGIDLAGLPLDERTRKDLEDRYHFTVATP